MSYTKSLRSYLADKSPTLFKRIEGIETDARTVLIYTVSKFPYYTPHDFSHSLNVEDILNWLIPDDKKREMDSYEIFLLLVSAWLHDWGMVGSAPEDPEIIRKTHHIRTQNNFDLLYEKVGLDRNEAEIAGRICRGHRDENIYSKEFNDSYLGSNVHIRTRFLAALLRLADECDVTANRTPEVIYASIKPQGLSDEEFRKHLTIIGIGKPSPYKIVLNGVAKTPKGALVIEAVKNKIQKQLDSVKEVLMSNGVLLDIVDANIDTKGFINKPISFELDRKNIINLLIGKALYKSDDVAIRELLQNAIDTCRLKKIIDKNTDPCITFEWSTEQLSIDDNGFGMNFDDAFNFFSNKGNSFYLSEELRAVLDGKDFDSISKFGIGLLSAFLICDEMVVETKKQGYPACRFTVTDFAEGWTYEEGSRKNVGTRITLKLNNSGKSLDILETVKHYAKNIEIPIHLKHDSCSELLVPLWTYKMPEVIDSLGVDHKGERLKKAPIFELEAISEELHFTLSFFKESYFAYNNCFISNQGIYVGSFDLFPQHSENWLILIDLKKDVVDLSVARDNILINQRFREFLDLLYEQVITVISANCTTNNELNSCIELSKTLFSMFDAEFGIERELPKSRWVSSLFMKRKHPILTSNGLIFLNGEEILKQNFKKIHHFASYPEFFSENFPFLELYLKGVALKNEVVLIEFEPTFEYLTYNPRKFYCSACELLEKRFKVDCLSLRDLFLNGKFPNVQTDLDSLLYSDSFFAHLPIELRSLTIENRKFAFKPAILASSNSIYRSIYSNLVAREFFAQDKDFFDYYSKKLYSDSKKTLIQKGSFIYDLDDPIIAFLISKSKDILADQSIFDLVVCYFKLLATNCVDESFRFAQSADLLVLTHFEKMLLRLLNYDGAYKPLQMRWSKAAQIYSLSP